MNGTNVIHSTPFGVDYGAQITLEKLCVDCGAPFTVTMHPTAAKYRIRCDGCKAKHEQKVEQEREKAEAAERLFRFNKKCPLDYQKLDRARLPLPEIHDKVMKQPLGLGLVLHGENGQAKTRSAFWRARYECLQGRTFNYADAQFSLDFNGFRESPAAAKSWVNNLCSTDILLLVDIFGGSLSPGAEGALLNILERRHQAKKPTIVVTSCTSEILQQKLSLERGALIVEALRRLQPIAFVKPDVA